MHRDPGELPPELADHFTRPLARFLEVEAVAGILLALATIASLVLSNSVWSGGFSRLWETSVGLGFGHWAFERSLRHWINDGLMTIFFFVVALELKRALVRGELRSLRMATFSFAGALGGMLGPALLYAVLLHGEPGIGGWGTVVATDTAFVMGALALLGARIPVGLRLYLLSLAIFDDLGAILVVAVGYGGELSWRALIVAAALVAGVSGAARLGLRSVALYALLGAALWLALDASGIHPTVAGVILGLMTPATAWVSDARLRTILERMMSRPGSDSGTGDRTERRHLREAGIATKEASSPVDRLEMSVHPWSAFLIMPLFALANAGVRISWADLVHPVSVAVFSGLLVGKPVGVFALSWLSVRVGLAKRPPGVPWAVLAAGSLLTGIGFTMSLFIAGLAFTPELLGTAKTGILAASIVAASAGLLGLLWLTRGEPAQSAEAGNAAPGSAEPGGSEGTTSPLPRGGRPLGGTHGST